MWWGPQKGCPHHLQGLQEMGQACPLRMAQRHHTVPLPLAPQPCFRLFSRFFFMFVQLEMTNLFQRTPVKNNIFMSLPQLARVCAGNAGDLSAASCKHRRWTSCTAHEHVLLSPGKQLFPYFISSSFPLFPICEGFQIPLKVRSCFCKITYSSDTWQSALPLLLRAFFCMSVFSYNIFPG